MFVSLILTLLACGTASGPGDLWLAIDTQTANETIALNLPANWMTDVKEPIWIDTPSGRIDLKSEAMSMRNEANGRSKSWKLNAQPDTSTLMLSKRARTGKTASKVGMQAVGPKGNGLVFSFALTPENVNKASEPLQNALDIQDGDFDVDRAMTEQLRVSGPVVLLKTKGPKGGGLVVETK